ncbi:hypothetical protein [Pseudomonas sp. L13]|uniref:hypothetical protein n=1 Tax=Pseudomonas sp. L13 TaxID=343985 RepID=UPI00137B7DBB|nr:hypothetical protein [Pseudomonas sp. L13]NCE90234.1 hypothetical protein [Pseudomonas sp. L13]
MLPSSVRKRDIETIEHTVKDALTLVPASHSLCVLLIGSWSQGLGTPTSDIDLVVISEVRLSGDWWQNFQRQIALSLGWTQVENITRDEFKRLIGKTQIPVYSPLSSRTLELAYKYANCLVLHGHDDFVELKSDFSLSEFSVKMADYYISKSMNIYQDILGARLTEDYRSAVIAVRELVGLGVDAVLALEGDAYPKAKWRVKRARRLPLEQALLDSIDRFLIGGPSGDYLAQWQWVEAALMFFRQLHFYVAFPGAAKAIAFPTLSAPCQGNPWAFALRANEKWRITRDDRIYEASQQSVLVWFVLAMGVSCEQLSLLFEVGSGPFSEECGSTLEQHQQFLKALGAL